MNAPTKVQIIHGADGKPAFVVIPYEHYRAQMQQDLVPHEVVCSMVERGWTPARAWREHYKLTQSQMASRLAITQSAYAQLEASETLRKSSRERIARALGIASDLLEL